MLFGSTAGALDPGRAFKVLFGILFSKINRRRRRLRGRCRVRKGHIDESSAGRVEAEDGLGRERERQKHSTHVNWGTKHI